MSLERIGIVLRTHLSIISVLILAMFPGSVSGDIVNQIGDLGNIDTDQADTRYPFLIVYPESLSTEHSEEINELAEMGLVKWKTKVKRSPKFCGVDTSRYDCNSASLSVPYYMYEVDTDRMAKYMSSGDGDPRRYARRYMINFPIYVEDRCLGAVSVYPNVNADGSKSSEEDNNFIQAGFVQSGDNFQNMIRKIRKVQKETGLTEVSASVLLFGSGPGDWYMQPAPDGKYFVFEDSEKGLWKRRPRSDNRRQYLH